MDTRTLDTPPALAWSPEGCQVERTMTILAERSAVVVLREVFNGVRRFDDMQRHSGVNRQVLTKRLAMLVEEGILVKVPYQAEGARSRHEYRLTQKGLDLYPVLVAVSDWGTKYVVGPDGPVVELTHAGCGSVVHSELVCEDGHRLAEVREVVPRPGPGARPFTFVGER